MVMRQCGSRKKGGVYAEVATSPDGMPLEFFFVDPPIPVDLAALGVTPRGVHLVEREGVWHIFDVVGTDNYPNVLDVIEEGRALGFSRRCELPDYSRLGPRSRLVLIHKRAMIANYPDYVSRLTPEQRNAFECPREVWMNRVGRRATKKNIHDLSDLFQMCAGLWRFDLTDVEQINAESAGVAGDFFQPAGSHVRRLECGTRYYGWPKPEGVEPQYGYAIFMSLPLGRLVVVEDPDGRTHEKRLEEARKADMAVDLVTE